MLFDFWRKLPPGQMVHPEDRPMLASYPGVFQLAMPPGQIGGPLRTAPVIACYLNPGYVRIPDQRDRCFRANVTEDSGGT